MLRGLAESAQAELERCAGARPDDADVLFERARLASLRDGGSGAAARARFEDVLAADPRSLAARRALVLLADDPGAALARERDEIERIAGPLGLFDVELSVAYARASAPPRLAFPDAPSRGLGLADYGAMVAAFQALQRAGGYDPLAAVRGLERVLAVYPDLAAVRHQYAHALDAFEVRIPTRAAREAGVGADPTVTPISSRLTLDLCARHYAAAFDRVPPGSGVAYACLRGLAEVALKMGEWEDAYL
jgi:hypothetical protein